MQTTEPSTGKFRETQVRESVIELVVVAVRHPRRQSLLSKVQAKSCLNCLSVANLNMPLLRNSMERALLLSARRKINQSLLAALLCLPFQ